MYDPVLIQPFRDDLTRVGIRELRTAAEVDDVLNQKKGTVLVVVNSVCGCAAGRARPAITQALQHANKPDVLTSVFAGQDMEATARAREWFGQIPPSSPSVALFKDGELVHFIPRFRIENRDAQAIAADLTSAFDEYCSAEKVTA
ncbi:MAG TPA: BrxA/BrxB family bacilliredoxin [Bacteroidota bacterium]|nr:BrxA/BrxB family bacilliredoxin [Bacteroidota bacterium]